MLEDRIKQIIGDLAFQLAVAQDRIATLEEQLKRLTEKKEKDGKS